MVVGLSQGKGADGREKRHSLRGSEADVQVQKIVELKQLKLGDV